MSYNLSLPAKEIDETLVNAKKFFKEGPFVTPKMFGAKGDGVTDDTAAIQAALNGNGRVFIPAGTYMVNAGANGDATYGIVVPSNREIVLDKNAVLKQIHTGAEREYILHLTNETSNVRISGGTLRGDRDQRSDGTDHAYGIRMDSVSNVWIEGVTIRELQGDGISMNVTTGSGLSTYNENVHILNCVIDHSYRNNIHVGIGRNIYIDNCDLNNADGGMPKAGIDIEAEHGKANEYIYISNCRFSGNGDKDIAVTGDCDNTVISDCICESKIMSSLTTEAQNIVVMASKVANANGNYIAYQGCHIGYAGCFSGGGYYKDCDIDFVEANNTDGSEFVFDGCTIRRVNSVNSNLGVLRFNSCNFVFTGNKSTRFYGVIYMVKCNVLFDSGYTGFGISPVNVTQFEAVETTFTMIPSLTLAALIYIDGNVVNRVAPVLIGCTFDVPTTVSNPIYSSIGATVVGCTFIKQSSLGGVTGTVIAHDNVFVGNPVNYLTTETDPTVPSWAKAATKPSYTKSEVGLGNVDNVKQYSASNPPPYPVTSVNGKTGAVTLTSETWTFELEDGSTVTKQVMLK